MHMITCLKMQHVIGVSDQNRRRLYSSWSSFSFRRHEKLFTIFTFVQVVRSQSLGHYRNSITIKQHCSFMEFFLDQIGTMYFLALTRELLFKAESTFLD